MRKLICLFAVLCLLFCIAPLSYARLSTNNRRAVVLECFYALRPSYDGSSYTFIGGNAVGSWNYLASDMNAYNAIRGWYGCFASLWAYSYESCFYQNTSTSFYSSLYDYGYGVHGGSCGYVGRGGQCKFFANLILYRSESDQRGFPTYSYMWTYQSEPDLTKAKEGDVIFVYDPYGTSHTAIVVEVKRDGYGNIYGLDVIDSNYISDKVPYQANREVIARHLLELDTDERIRGKYRIWKGASYYNEPYVP